MIRGSLYSKSGPGNSIITPLRAIQGMVPKTDDELWYWVKGVLGIEIPRQRICPNHSSPFQAFADAYFARSSLSVWKASRAFGGKSMLLATLAVTEAITLGAKVVLLGGSGEQSKRVHRYMNGEDSIARGKFWESPSAPRRLLKGDPLKQETMLTNGGAIKALMASQTSVRGPHPHRLRLDEIDEMKLSLFDAAMGQTMGGEGIPGQTVCSSTHQHPDGTMSEILRRANEQGFPVYEWCYRETLQGNTGGWLQEEEIDRKRKEMTKTMWETEVELQEPNPEGRAIDGPAVESLFNRGLGEYSGQEGTLIRLVAPGVGEFYHGTDWAKSNDWTVIHSNLKREGNPDRLAAWLRLGRRPWPQMISKYNDRVREYGGRSVHDVTGIGGVCADYLEVDSFGFDFTARKKRNDMISNYIAAIENGELEYPMINWAYNEHRFATLDDLYGSGHLPDSIAAAALAHEAGRRKVRKFLVGKA